MNVPKRGSIYLRNLQNDEVQLGPLIGVLSDGPGTSSNPFGSRTGFIKQLLREGGRKSYIYAFTPRDINWQNETVSGFLNENGSFVRKTVPLPDVVYNRLPSRRSDFSPAINQLRERFVRRKIPFFNWSFFNKSDIYKLLENDPEAGRYIPESITNPTVEQMREMLERHQFVYYKPTAGSLGNGIYRLTYSPKRGYFARYRKKAAMPCCALVPSMA